MIVFVVGERLFNDRDGRGVGATTMFRAAGLLVARGPLHAERALVPLTVNPNMSEDNGAAGNPFFFSKLNGMGK